MIRRLVTIALPIAAFVVCVTSGLAAAASAPVVIIGPVSPASVGSVVSLSAQCTAAVPAAQPWHVLGLAGALLIAGVLYLRRRRYLGLGVLVASALTQPTPKVAAQANACAGVTWAASLGSQQFTGSGATFAFTPTIAGTYAVTATLGGYVATLNISVSSINCSGSPLTGGTQTCSSDATGTSGGYTWSLRDSGSGACMTPYGVGAAYQVTWNNSGDVLALEGLQWDATKPYTQLGTITADYAEAKTGTAGGFSFIGVYGWSNNPVVEYFIVDDSFGGTPNPGGTLQGSYTVDGGTYNVYTKPISNQPTPWGTLSYVQYYSVRQAARQCGHISVTAHFTEWSSLGLVLGLMYQGAILVEAGGGTGSVAFTAASMAAQ